MNENTDQELFYLRVRQTGNEYLVAICDRPLLGETICEGETELFVNENFFGGKLAPLDDCLKEMSQATSFNLIGNKIVLAAIEARLIHEFAVLWINTAKFGRVGHVMFVR
ncbi:MAG: DUF424 family protein [Candidatus Heimdallarchaeota archaeon]|nr:DUF424 family protein [Candidatus Heimdallarchaeota archaeon]